MNFITSILAKKNSTILLVFIIQFSSIPTNAQTKNKIIKVEPFDKVIVAPHIQVVFTKGEKESVTIESITESEHKFHAEIENNTLKMYLDGAKIFTKSEKNKEGNYNQKRKPIYKGTVVKAVVTYVDIKELSLRGSENHICKDLIMKDDFEINIYGESNVLLNEIDIKNFKACLYGDNTLELKKGVTKNQNFIVYGDATINALGVQNKNTKTLTYGDGKININTSENLKVSSYGDATIQYKGNPSIKKGINIGDSSIKKLN